MRLLARTCFTKLSTGESDRAKYFIFEGMFPVKYLAPEHVPIDGVLYKLRLSLTVPNFIKRSNLKSPLKSLPEKFAKAVTIVRGGSSASSPPSAPSSSSSLSPAPTSPAPSSSPPSPLFHSSSLGSLSTSAKPPVVTDEIKLASKRQRKQQTQKESQSPVRSRSTDAWSDDEEAPLSSMKSNPQLRSPKTRKK